jgi:hypothetical protein
LMMRKSSGQAASPAQRSPAMKRGAPNRAIHGSRAKVIACATPAIYGDNDTTPGPSEPRQVRTLGGRTWTTTPT